MINRRRIEFTCSGRDVFMEINGFKGFASRDHHRKPYRTKY